MAEYTHEQLRSYYPLRRGYILARLSGSAEFVIPFLFNPRPIREQEQAKYANHVVPGYADPVLQYLYGEALTITFSVILERERLDQVNKVPSATDPQPSVPSYRRTLQNLDGTAVTPSTIEDYIELYRAMLLPRSNAVGATGGFEIPKSPPRLVFFFGYEAVQCRMTRLNISKEEYRADMSIDYAELDVTLVRDDPLNKRAISFTQLGTSTIKLPGGIGSSDVIDATSTRPAQGEYSFN